MNHKPWFYTENNRRARRERAAYEKSLKSRHAVKIRDCGLDFYGHYYYRGFYLGATGNKRVPWCFFEINGPSAKLKGADTKKQAMAAIDDILSREAEQHD